MSNLSFYLWNIDSRKCELVVTSKIDQQHKIIFPSESLFRDFRGFGAFDFSIMPEFLNIKKIYSDGLFSKLNSTARLRFNERFSEYSFQRHFFD